MLPLLAGLLLVAHPPLVPQEAEGATRPPLPSAEEIARLPADGGDEFNRLVFSRSPYLLQHARNPVDWYPWGDEAFARAKELDRPVFLSIGYSTCHWCHVMEHESFEDEAVAALLNESFVSVKVDREERPDLDHQYMAVTQAMTGGGGWPMTVLLTPERVPFFAATYIPKQSRFGRKGMLELLPEVAAAWDEQRDGIERQAQAVRQFLAGLGGGAPGPALDAAVLARAVEQFTRMYDAERGGFGRAPKFPVPHNLLFLLQVHGRTGADGPREMVAGTLAAMRRGGIFDQVGFGFHRYSTDAAWLVPHFEKMLYDQALLAMAYTAGWQVTGDPEHRRTAEEVFAYVLRDLTAPSGAFYSAEDADSEGEEGRFYLWTRAEVLEVLGEEEGALFARVFNVHPEGNFVDEVAGERSERNIPHLTAPWAELADGLGVEEPALRARIESARRRLFEAREARVHPFKDDKILTDWNGLMIAALARAGRAFDDPGLTDAARRAARFALDELLGEEGRPFKLHRAGSSSGTGTLEDHAFLAWGLLELYETTFDVAWLDAALGLTETMLAHFWDAEAGGLFLSADDVEDVLVRGKEAHDGATPAGQSVAAWNLLRLARITGRAAWEERAQAVFATHAAEVAQQPVGHGLLLLALDFALGPSFEVVVAGDPTAEDTRALLRAFQARYLPHAVVVQRPPGDAPPITARAAYTRDQRPLEGAATAYVCRDFACKQPTTDVATAVGFLDPESWEE